MKKIWIIGMAVLSTILTFSFGEVNTTYAAAHVYANQDVTAYVRYSTSTKPAGGGDYYWGVAAVRYQGSNPLNPIVPFGTTVSTSLPIKSPIGSGTSFTVIDTGAMKPALSPNNLDIYWGEWYNQDSALSFGQNKMTLTYYY